MLCTWRSCHSLINATSSASIEQYCYNLFLSLCVPLRAALQVPQQVNDRILNRILVFAGVPVFLGFSLFPLFYYLKVSYAPTGSATTMSSSIPEALNPTALKCWVQPLPALPLPEGRAPPESATAMRSSIPAPLPRYFQPYRVCRV